MKVIGSGFGRTGTLSLKQALEDIGYRPCYHMEEVIQRPSHIRLWHQIANGQSVDWGDLFADFQATVDFPGSTVYKELLVAYPDAKVIHTIRDPEQWYDSTYETIYQARFIFPRWFQKLVPFIGQFLEMHEGLFWGTIFEGQFENRQRMIEIFHEHTEAVKGTVPTDRLLIFEVKEGWQPLCRFLDVPVPDRPFPHVNDKAAMQRRFQLIRIVLRVVPVALVGLLLYVLSRLMKTNLKSISLSLFWLQRRNGRQRIRG